MRFSLPVPFRFCVLAGAFVAMLVACGSKVDGTGGSGGSGGSAGSCLQGSDVCTCICGGMPQPGLSSQAIPDCSSWEGRACSAGDGGSVPSSYSQCKKTGTMCWSP